MYQLVFKGECTPGTDLETARNNARALFKASVEQLDRMTNVTFSQAQLDDDRTIQLLVDGMRTERERALCTA